MTPAIFSHAPPALPCSLFRANRPHTTKPAADFCPLSLKASKRLLKIASTISILLRLLPRLATQREATLTQSEGTISRLAPVSSSQGLARHYGIISQTIRPPLNRTERQSSFHHPSNGKWTLTVHFRRKKHCKSVSYLIGLSS